MIYFRQISVEKNCLILANGWFCDYASKLQTILILLKIFVKGLVKIGHKRNDFFKLGFTPCRAKRLLQGTELQEKEPPVKTTKKRLLLNISIWPLCWKYF